MYIQSRNLSCLCYAIDTCGAVSHVLVCLQLSLNYVIVVIKRFQWRQKPQIIWTDGNMLHCTKRLQNKMKTVQWRLLVLFLFLPVSQECKCDYKDREFSDHHKEGGPAKLEVVNQNSGYGRSDASSQCKGWSPRERESSMKLAFFGPTYPAKLLGRFFTLRVVRRI